MAIDDLMGWPGRLAAEFRESNDQIVSLIKQMARTKDWEQLRSLQRQFRIDDGRISLHSAVSVFQV